MNEYVIYQRRYNTVKTVHSRTIVVKFELFELYSLLKLYELY